jgi:predicted MFS family arabinose efflux permease
MKPRYIPTIRSSGPSCSYLTPAGGLGSTVRPSLAVAVIGWGAALVPLGLVRLPGLALACFAVGGLLYAPYPALSATLFQRESPPQMLSQVLAARGALTVLAAPLGTALGGPLTAWLGPQETLLVSAAATIAAGVAAVAVITARRRRPAIRDTR